MTIAILPSLLMSLESKRLICLKQNVWSKRWVLGTSNTCPDHLSGQFLTTASTFPYSSKNSSAEHIHAFLYISLCAWVRQCVCVCVCEWVCVCVCVFIWVSLFVMVSYVDKGRICSAEEWERDWLCEWVCVFVREWVCLSMWMSVCLTMWVSECVCICLCEWVSECLWWSAMLIKHEYVRLKNF